MVHTNKVFVHPNPTRANAVKALPEVLDFLLSEGFHVYMDSMYAQSLGKEYKVVSYASAEECMSAADFILVLGGDGTILHIASSAACHGKPVLGINFGTLGFLTELDISDLEMLKQIEEDRHKLDRRLLLDVRVWREISWLEPGSVVCAAGADLHDAVWSRDRKLFEQAPAEERGGQPG